MIKYGIVGTGSIAKIHAEIINDIPDVCLYGAHDIIDTNLESFCSEFKTNPFKDIHAMLSEIDVAIICSPNFCHIEHIIKALNHQCHILCEKPLTINLSESKLLHACLYDKKAVKSINLNYRNLIVIQQIIELIENNEIGEIISIHMSSLKNSAYRRKFFTWRDDGASKLSSGALGDLGVHLLDLVTHITKSNVKVETIKTKMMTKVKEKDENIVQVDDHSETFFLTNRGQHIHIETSNACDDSQCGFHISISGYDGEIKFSSTTGNMIILFNDNGQQVIELANRKYIDPENEFYGWKDSFYNTHLNLLSAIQNQEYSHISTFSDGLNAQEILEYCINNNKNKNYGYLK